MRMVVGMVMGMVWVMGMVGMVMVVWVVVVVKMKEYTWGQGQGLTMP